MKAIQYSRLGGTEVLEFRDVPVPNVGTGEVLLRVKAAAMNHLDVHFRRGLPAMKCPLPHIPGSDGAGVVEEIGAGVKNVRVGDRVVMNPGVSCGTCDRCLGGEKSLCHKYFVIGRECDGTDAEFICVPSHNVIPIPEHVSFETAAAAPLVYLTAWSMLAKTNLLPGNTVLVMGAGSGVSMAAIQIANLMGAKVYTTASTREKAALAEEKLPVERAIVYTETAIDTELRALTNKRGVDIVIDHIGGNQWVPILRATRNGGTVVTCGATAGFDPTEDLRQIFYRQVRVIGSTMGNDAELLAPLRLVFEGKLKPIIDSVLPLKVAAEGHRRMESRKLFGKIILVP